MNSPVQQTAEFFLAPDSHVEMAALSDVGLVRQHNEDSFLLADVESGEVATDNGAPGIHVHARPALIIVADGVGGAASGEIASSMATKIAFEHISKTWRDGGLKGTVAVADTLRKAVEAANGAIFSHAKQNTSHRGMGTTATIVLIVGEQAYLAQVGDSRAYIVRDGTARQVTKDQSLVQRLIDAGRMTAEQAARSEHRNIILQALGPDESIEPELTRERLRSRDFLLVCSDGLSNQVTDEEMATACEKNSSLDRICSTLIERAKETGAPDNVTVVAAKYWRDRDKT